MRDTPSTSTPAPTAATAPAGADGEATRTLAEKPMPRVPEITEDLAHLIYDVLSDECGARLAGRGEFVQHVLGRPLTGSQTEFRFGGSLGRGGKFYCDSFGSWSVDCYPEDKTDSRRAFIADAMTRLRRLANVASPAPAGAGHGERRWGVIYTASDGLPAFTDLFPHERDRWRAEQVAANFRTSARVVPVRVTIDDAEPVALPAAGETDGVGAPQGAVALIVTLRRKLDAAERERDRLRTVLERIGGMEPHQHSRTCCEMHRIANEALAPSTPTEQPR